MSVGVQLQHLWTYLRDEEFHLLMTLREFQDELIAEMMVQHVELCTRTFHDMRTRLFRLQSLPGFCLSRGPGVARGTTSVNADSTSNIEDNISLTTVHTTTTQLHLRQRAFDPLGWILLRTIGPKGYPGTGYKDDFFTLVKWWDIAGTPELLPNYSTLA